MVKTINRVYDHYHEALNLFPENKIIGIFVSGSQNYGLADENSDVDTKLIITPSINDFVFNRSPVSSTHILENNEHIEIKDVRLMFNCYKKQNINFIETLFTNYYILNPIYEDIFAPLMNNENIPRYDEEATLYCVKGMIETNYRQLAGTRTQRPEIVEKFGYNPKKLDNILRLQEFAQSYINGASYLECIRSIYPEYHKKIKREKIDDIKLVYNLAENAQSSTNQLIDNYFASHKLIKNKEVEKLLDETQYKLIKKSLELEGVNFI